MAEQIKPKMALCAAFTAAPDAVKAATKPTLFPINPLSYGIDDLFKSNDLKLIPRSICETDFDWLQFIPYIVVLDKDNPRRVLTYCRGQGSGEERLHNRLSIGLGGHVEELPDYDRWRTLTDTLQLCAKRELEEEIGLFDFPWVSIRFSHLIYNPIEDVNKVHIGVLTLWQISSDLSGLKLEANVIEQLKFVDIDELQAIHDEHQNLESWSALVLGALRSGELTVY